MEKEKESRFEIVDIIDMYSIDRVDENGIIYLKLDKVIRKLGLFYFENGALHTHWDVVNDCLLECGVDTTDGFPEYISMYTYSDMRRLVKGNQVSINQRLLKHPFRIEE